MEIKLTTEEIVDVILDNKIDADDVKLILTALVDQVVSWDDIINPIIFIINERLGRYKDEIIDGISEEKEVE